MLVAANIIVIIIIRCLHATFSSSSCRKKEEEDEIKPRDDQTETITAMLMLMTIMRATAVQSNDKDDRSRLYSLFSSNAHLLDEIVHMKDSRKTSGRILLTMIVRRYH